MPQFYFSFEHKAYVKECSCCKEIFVGTAKQGESEEIFLKYFALSQGTAQTGDNLQSRCWICNQAGRRALGITFPLLQAMFDKQDGKCAICDKQLSIERSSDSAIQAHVDHDEDSNEIRELLCGGCNRGIGMFRHNRDLLYKAGDYCHHYQAVIELKGRRKA